MIERSEMRVLLPVALLVFTAVSAPQLPKDPYLALGIRQFSDGDFEAAVFTLDTVARRLAGDRKRLSELAEAYVYLGATFVALGNETAAEGKFREALKLNPKLELSPQGFSESAIRVFNRKAVQNRAAAKKRNALIFLLGAAVGAGAGVGVAAANRPEPPNVAPTAILTTSPSGEAIAGVTVMTFTVRAVDANVDSLAFSWDFGDGEGAAGHGAVINHVYRSQGSFRVTVKVTDGRGGQAAAEGAVVARTLTGTWLEHQSVIYELRQEGTLLTGSERCPYCNRSSAKPSPVTGTISTPRLVEFSFPGLPGGCGPWIVRGEVDETLNAIVGTRACELGALAVALTRQ